MVVWAGSLRKDCSVHLPVLAQESGLEEGVAEGVAGGSHVIPGTTREVLSRFPSEGEVKGEVEECERYVDVGSSFGVVGEEKREVVWRRDNVFVG